MLKKSFFCMDRFKRAKNANDYDVNIRITTDFNKTT